MSIEGYILFLYYFLFSPSLLWSLLGLFLLKYQPSFCWFSYPLGIMFFQLESIQVCSDFQELVE